MTFGQYTDDFEKCFEKCSEIPVQKIAEKLHVSTRQLSASILQIVRRDRTMEQIVFPVPNICEYLTAESRINVYQTCERDDQNSKVTSLQMSNLFISISFPFIRPNHKIFRF